MGKFSNDFTGQITGSAYCDAASAVTPPSGKVILGIYFIQDNILALSGAKFPAGSTIYGRWTSVTPAADADGGIIVYFGE